MWLIGGPIALVPAIAVPLVIGFGLILQVPLNRVVRRAFQEAAQKHGVLVESINGLETIKSVRAEGRMQRNWEQFVSATARSGMRARLLSGLGVNVSVLAQNLVTIGIVIFGVYRIGEGLLTVGGLVACTIITGRAMAPLAQVAGILTRYHQARAAYDALSKVMALPVERPAQIRFLHRPRLRGEVAFKGVTFAYPGQKQPALDQVSFTVQAGERVGLVGRIGSGKTTIEKLVLGLYEPDQGAVLIDGTDLRQIDPADLRRNIGCVLQDVVLFHGTRARQHHARRAVRRRRRRCCARRASPGSRTSSPAIRWASTSTSGSGASGCPAASGRRWRWRGRCCWSRRSWCSTSRAAPWTMAPKAGSSSASSRSCRAGPCCW